MIGRLRVNEGCYTKIIIENFAGFILAFAPVFSQYVFHGIEVTWLLAFFCLGLCVLVYRSKFFVFSLKYLNLLIYVLIAAVVSVNGIIIGRGENALNAVISLIINLIIYVNLYRITTFKIFFKWLNFLAVICCIYAFYQLVMQILTGSNPVGLITFMGIEPANGWVKTSWGFRFNSLFSEPSYFAIFLLPVVVSNLIYTNYLMAIVSTLAILVSSSSLGILGLVIVWGVFLFSTNLPIKKKVYILISVAICMIFVLYVVKHNPQLASILNRSFDKINNLGNREDNSRFGGYLPMFKKYPLKEMFLGCGIYQFANYMSQQGIYVSNYSNSIVLTLLNMGLIGFASMIVFFILLYRDSRRKNTRIFFCLLLMIFSIDAILLGYRFYYLLYFVLFFENRKMGEEIYN